ncbi:hypothetical protein GOODEAATRI_032879, partial [Goodea atripinnis]
ERAESLSLSSVSSTLEAFMENSTLGDSPSLSVLVDQGSSTSTDTVASSSGESPIERVHRVLKSTMPGQGRELQVNVPDTIVFDYMSLNLESDVRMFFLTF